MSKNPADSATRQAGKQLRIPVAVEGIQVNFCKNPRCLNFGVPANPEAQKKGRPKGGKSSDGYMISGGGSKPGQSVPVLKCKRCGEHPTIKSNLAITQEVARFWPTKPSKRGATSCPGHDCDNHGRTIAAEPKLYIRHGSTSSGASRYRCKRCGKLFSAPHPTSPASRQTVHKHKNIAVYKLLVAKVPFNRICELEQFSMRTLRQKLTFLYNLASSFGANRERGLPLLQFPKLGIAVDRQDYVINWDNNNDKRNVTLHCIASADNKSGYIFGTHLDYDPAMDPQEVERDAIAGGDYLLKPPFRRHARLWLQNELLPLASAKGASVAGTGAIIDKVRETYRTAEVRADVEVPAEGLVIPQLPHKGMQVHSEYAIYGHFEFLKRLLPGCEKFVFYLDQESGIRAACHAAFWEQILAKRCDAFYVTIDKELTVNQKRKLKADSDRDLADYVAKNPWMHLLHANEVRLFFLKEILGDTVTAGKWHDEWLVYPFPDMSEPKKAVCWLTDLRDHAYSDDELAQLYLDATLHGIDRFFMQMRRLVSPLERPIISASSARRLWNAYAPYDPLVVTQLVELFRIYYNFIKVGKDGKTPAMRLGLAKGPVRFEDIIYFTG